MGSYLGKEEKDTNLDKVKEITNKLTVKDDQLKQIMKDMNNEFNVGLKDESLSSIKMLLTYVRDVPKGDETGRYLALDLGGTNFRTLMITLVADGQDEPPIVQETHAVAQELMRAPGEELFDYIAGCLLKFARDQNLERGRYPLGFTFSFPCEQFGLSVSKLVRWTKGFTCPGVEGENVAKLLRDAIRRKQQEINVDAMVDVVAVINDTTGTMMSCAHLNKDCCVGLIVGTGSNACYMEQLDKIEKWPGNYSNPNQCVVNTEWGAFGENGELDLIRTEWDKQMDTQTVNPTKQLFEKMISGLYLGEIVRHVLVDLCQQNLLFNGQVPAALMQKNGFSTKQLSEAESDETNSNLRIILIDEIGVGNVTDYDLNVVRLVCKQVSTRAAYVVAVGCSVIIERIKRDKVVIGYDGSVVKKHPKFCGLMESKIKDLISPGRVCELMLSNDGSGRGAAVVAAVAFREKRPFIFVRSDKKNSGRKKVYEFTSYLKAANK